MESESSPPERFRLGGVLTVAAGHLFHDTFGGFLAPVLPLLIGKLGFSYSLAGLLGVFQRGPSLINPLVGLLADRVSLRYFVIFAPAVTAAAMSLIPLAPSYLFMAVMLLVMGTSSALFHVPAPVMVRRLSGSRLGAGISIFMVGGELARSIGPVLILAAVSWWGMEGTWRLFPLGLAASAMLFFRLRGVSARVSRTAGPAAPGFARVLKEMRGLFLVVGGLVISRAVLAAALTTFLPTYLTARGASLWLAGISLSVLELSGAAGALASGTLSDRIGRRNMLLINTILAPLLMGLFLFTGGWAALPVLVLMGFFVLSVTPVLIALVQDNAPQYPASANGIFMTMNFVALSLTMLLVGALSDAIGLVNTYRVCAALSLIGPVFALLLPRGRPRAQ